MGCNCSCAKNETLSEMVAEPEYPPDINENLNNLNNINIDIKEKENKSERTSIQSQLSEKEYARELRLSKGGRYA